MIEKGDEVEVEMGSPLGGRVFTSTATVSEICIYEGEEETAHIKIESDMVETWSKAPITSTPLGFCRDCNTEKIYHDKKENWYCPFCEI